MPGDEAETTFKEKNEALEAELEELKQLKSQLMTRLEIMNREMNELKITSEEFDIKSEAGSASTGSGDRAGFTLVLTVPGPDKCDIGNQCFGGAWGGPYIC